LNLKQEGISYVLITPARNEEKDIERTIKSVISQTILPGKWVIVSDGSTDRTEEIVKRYMESNKWIELIQMPARRDRTFAAKAYCFNVAYHRISKMDFDIIGNLDADISFESDYFEFILEKFIEFKDLGVAGTPMIEHGYDSATDAIFNETDVFGACQIFRRTCFDQIGGYTPIKWGGIDWVAIRTARMHGWKTRSFLEKRFFHHRPMGATGSNKWAAKYNYGRKDYFLGNHPLWELLRVSYQLWKKPYLIGGIVLFFGYVFAFISRMKRPIPRELIMFHRREQMQRLKCIIRNYYLEYISKEAKHGYTN
jgi:glycosyltransferase involved in cell wall biosynthesis